MDIVFSYSRKSQNNEEITMLLDLLNKQLKATLKQWSEEKTYGDSIETLKEVLLLFSRVK